MHRPVQSLVNTLYFQILILIFIKSIYRQIVLCVNAWKFIFHICLSKGIIPLLRICLFPPWTRSCSSFFPQRFLRHGARDAHSVPGIYSGRLWNCQCTVKVKIQATRTAGRRSCGAWITCTAPVLIFPFTKHMWEGIKINQFRFFLEFLWNDNRKNMKQTYFYKKKKPHEGGFYF